MLIIAVFSIFALSACENDVMEISCIDSEEFFFSKLMDKNFLPPGIMHNLRDSGGLETFLDYEGYPVSYWRTLDYEGGVIHKIEITTETDNQILIRYHYKYYDFDIFAATDSLPLLSSEKLTLDQGKDLAMLFIAEFRPDLINLDWENGEWYLSIYDRGNIEAWIANDGTHNYGIMIDLQLGLVVYFSRDML
ncbi:MAG: hypothetical protein FWD01_05240 [Defluviitaleaceae bacterium]|nr:hypothetical protein [Defluviitaleaceae bacterium]